MNGSSDNQPSLADPSSLSSSSSSLFSSSSYSSVNNNGNCFTIEAQLPLVKNKVEELEKFQRLLTRLDTVYNNNKNMSTTALPPPSSSHIQDRYLFRSLSNDNQNSRISSTTPRKNKLSNNPTPPSLKKRYKFPTVTTDQNNNNVYKFPNGQTEQRSHSTDSDRYYFSPDESIKKPQQTLTYVRSGSGLEQRAVTFIDGTSVTTDKISSPTKSIQPTTIIPDTPYLFSKTTESQRHPSATSSVNPEGNIKISKFEIYLFLFFNLIKMHGFINVNNHILSSIVLQILLQLQNQNVHVHQVRVQILDREQNVHQHVWIQLHQQMVHYQH